MYTSQRHHILLGLLVLVFIAQTSYSQTITSTGAGGNWEATSTWVGGVVPSANSDVVIAGPVGYATGTGFSCRSLTVNSGGSLFNRTGYAWPDQILIVNGNVVNNGTIRNEGGNGLVLRVKGNISNSGTWTFRRTELTGAAQSLSSGGINRFASPIVVDTNFRPALTAASALVFSSYLDLGKSSLDMKGFAISFIGPSANIGNGTIANAGDVNGQWADGGAGIWFYYPVLSNVTYNGTPNIRGRIQIDWGVVMAGTLTVTDTLENSSGYAHPEKKLTINGNLVNNGIIRNGGSNGLALIVSGNITNNGKWVHNRTELSGKPDQILTLGANKFFETAFAVTDSVGSIVAGSDLAFMQSFSLKNSTLDMKGYSLTLKSTSANITVGQVANTKDVIGLPTDGGAGIWFYYPVLSNVTYNGTPNIRGRIQIDWGVVMAGTLTVTDTLENSSGYAHPEKKLTINGNLVNNGIIRNGGSNGLALIVSGNITNNGKWIHNRTELSGSNDQTLALGTGKLFEASFRVADSLGMIVGGSNLAFSSGFDLRKCVLDMKSYGVTLQGGAANIYNGIVINTKDLIGKQVADIHGTPTMDNITYNGSINLRGILRVNSGTLQGDVTVIDTIQNSSGYAHPEKFLKIVGNITNKGLVQDGGSNGFVLDVTGNITATKAFVNKRIQLAGLGNRTIVDKVSQLAYLSTGEQVALFGDNFMPNLSIAASSKCMLAGGSSLRLADNNIDERLDNWSVITIPRKINPSQTNSFFKARITVFPSSGIDSMKVSSFGHQVPARFANAVRTWYRLERVPKTSTASLSSLTMYYRHDELGKNVESNLQVYFSADTGKTWKQISTSANLTRDTSQNFVAVTDAPSAGDFLLSSSPDPISVRPSVVVSLIGRSQIRIGPPNQYTVQYVNNSDVETGDMLLELRGTGGVHVRSVNPSPLPGYPAITVPIDSLTYDGDDTSALLWITSMAPREERTFSLIATASGGLGKTASTAEPITLTAVVVYIGVGLMVDYVTDAVVNGTEAAYATKVSNNDMKQATSTALKEVMSKQKIGKEYREAPAKKIVGEVAENLVEHFAGVVLWPLKLGKVILVDCVGGAIKGANRYLGNEEYNAVHMDERQKPLTKVASCDPNEKIAPDGIGAERFISTVARMNYQILFENKKEATAPAYTIQIVDTLQADFDTSSVMFGKTSHDGPMYNWQMTRNGRILKWRIDAIELPPNVNPPEGEGFVTFSVMPKSGVASGTVLKNTATITFDVNAPIRTNQVSNILDLVAPATIMKPIAPKVTSNKIVVKWQSSDGTNGSGVESATVFASKDGGAYIDVGTTAADSLVFLPGGGSHRYSFYVLAKDYVGNVESARPTPVTSDIVNDAHAVTTIPLEFSLSQNYPNPFNPATTIEFSLATKSWTTLKVYDILGREVETLVDEVRNAGRFSVIWNAGSVSSGVYFCRLTAGDASSTSFVQTRKLVLLK